MRVNTSLALVLIVASLPFLFWVLLTLARINRQLLEEVRALRRLAERRAELLVATELDAEETPVVTPRPAGR